MRREKWKLPTPSQDPLFQRTYLKPLFVNLRCPGCHKLYRADTADLKSENPEFKCSACETEFSFSVDDKDPRKGVTKIRGVPSTPSSSLQFSSLAKLDFVESIESLRSCPKCKQFNPQQASECRHCGVLFSKVEGLPLDQKLGAVPSLVRAWQELMQDYDNVTKHLSFVNQCEEFQAIPFALKRYEALKKAQPNDKLAIEMFHQVLMRSLGKKAEAVAKEIPLRQVIINFPWWRVVRLAPMGLGAVLIATGLVVPALRNLVGIGVSILFLTLGIQYAHRGRIHWADFWY